MTDNRQDLTDRYIRGEMNDGERTAFERRMQTDEELREIYRYTLRVSRVVKDRNEKYEKMQQWERRRCAARPRRSAGSWSRLAYAVACAAAIVAAVFFINRRPSMPRLDMHRYECYRGANCVQHVANLIAGKQYDSAIYLIERAEEDFRSDADSLARLMQKASADRLRSLEYENSANKLDYDELRWLKVYALMGQDRYDDAEKLLRDISSGEGKYRALADSILNR